MIVKNTSPPSQNAIDCVDEAKKVDGNFIIVDCDGLGIGTWQELNKIPDINDKYHLLKFHGSARISRKFNTDITAKILKQNV